MKRVTLRTLSGEEVTFIGERLNHLCRPSIVFPQHLQLSYGCHTHPSFSYSTIRALLGLVGLRASGGLVCGPLSAYVVHFGVSSWHIFLVIDIVP